MTHKKAISDHDNHHNAVKWVDVTDSEPGELYRATSESLIGAGSASVTFMVTKRVPASRGGCSTHRPCSRSCTESPLEFRKTIRLSYRPSVPRS